MIAIKKLYSYIAGKSVKQRICIGIVITAMLTLFVFTVKANFFDRPLTDSTSQAEISETVEIGESGETAPQKTDLPPLHISLIDIGVLLAVITAYCIHKIREKKKQGRL